jgi:hypothetical protein
MGQISQAVRNYFAIRWIGQEFDYRSPHVCFTMQLVPATDVRNELARILKMHLRARFGPVREINTWILALSMRWFFGSSVIGLQLGEKAFSVIWFRSRYENGEWIVVVVPVSLTNSPELVLICREIHTLLAATAGVTRIRWYSEGPRIQGAEVVTTPDELPWTQTYGSTDK